MLHDAQLPQDKCRAELAALLALDSEALESYFGPRHVLDIVEEFAPQWEDAPESRGMAKCTMSGSAMDKPEVSKRLANGSAQPDIQGANQPQLALAPSNDGFPFPNGGPLFHANRPQGVDEVPPHLANGGSVYSWQGGTNEVAQGVASGRLASSGLLGFDNAGTDSKHGRRKHADALKTTLPKLPTQAFLATLRPLLPRLYSISSSMLEAPSRVQVCFKGFYVLVSWWPLQAEF